MSIETIDAPAAARLLRVQARAAVRYDVRVATAWTDVASRWRTHAAKGHRTLFQQFCWLDAWYTQIIGPEPNVSPLLVEAFDAVTGELAVAAPLISTQRGSRRVLAFADLTLTDYNAPILGPAAPADAAGARALWRAITRALPPHDLADLRKMPPVIDGRPNPLALLRGVTPCALNGNLIPFPPAWDTYHYGLVRADRMEFERCWRVFQRDPAAHFVRIRDPGEAMRALDFMDVAQRERLAETGAHFVLDRPHVQAVYRHDLAARLAAGTIILTALKVDDVFVAAVFAVADGRTAVILRIAHAGAAFKKIGPGVLSVHRTLHHLHAEGFAAVDLSIGNYAYKTRLKPTAMPLVDLVQAQSWRGQPSAMKHGAVSTLRRHPALDARVRGLVSGIVRRVRGA